MTRAMISTPTHKMAHTTLRAIFGLGAMTLLATAAGAGSVESACASDYFAYCSQHPTEGAAVRKCMRAHGSKLSRGCVNALIAAGEVSKKEVARRSSK